MSFKLLAIRPLEKCNPKFLKNLVPNQIYKFYNNYLFLDNIGNQIERTDKYIEVSKIQSYNIITENIYNQDNTKINISAIVGKNGSGKSTIVELFIATVNQLSFFLKDKKKITTDAELINCQKKDLLFECELYYKLNNKYYKLIITAEDYKFYIQSDNNFINKTDDFELSNFFYSEIINYSHYAYNARTMDWINGLFHKNDAYQIPIVINPKRENEGLEGIIDINNENYLLQQRLLANLLKKSVDGNYFFRNIGDNKLAIKIKLTSKSAKDFTLLNSVYPPEGNIYNEDNEKEKKYFINDYSEYNLSGILFKQQQFQITNPLEILTKVKDKYKISEIKFPDQHKFEIYLIYKVISICSKYPSFFQFLEKDSSRYRIKIDEFLDNIDDSHIFYKIKQTINFIKFYDEIWKQRIVNAENIINIEELSNDLYLKSDDKNPLITLLPPPIFETEIILKHLISKSEIEFDTLSSGEKQLIHSTSTVLYHLNNINSVKKDLNRKKYENVNIIFEEIELYFHPEYQRKYIDYLLKNIKNLQFKEDGIKSLSFIFVTHSPFILSDIPKQNILFLDIDEKSEKSTPQEYDGDNTFSENIYDLLKHSFFLNDFIGEFSKNKFISLSNFLNSKEIMNDEWKEETATNFINIIGDSLIRESFRVLLDEKFGINREDSKIKELEKEIQRLNEKYGV